MIDIKKEKDCCGCSACLQRCPQKCIQLKADLKGFYYPHVNRDSCVHCGLCLKVCPELNKKNKRKTLGVYLLKHDDEKIRRESSSGGFFTLLAEKVIDEGGVVFGAKFSSTWDVIHTYVDQKEDLRFLRGSKYVQSYVGDSFLNVELFLKQGLKVLFTGTPCQIAGLNTFLKKEYNNLITVDFICHGVPSPRVWKMYLSEIIKKHFQINRLKMCSNSGNRQVIQNITFRDKRLGWRRYSFTLSFVRNNEHSIDKIVSFSEVFGQNIYMRGFLENLYLRPCCYDCSYKCLQSGSDLTIGDFWGIHHLLPEHDDDKGTSLVLINSDKGRQIHFSKNCEVLYEDVLKYNSALEHSACQHPNVDYFWKILDQSENMQKSTDLALRKGKTLRFFKKRVKVFREKLIDYMKKQIRNE